MSFIDQKFNIPHIRDIAFSGFPLPRFRSFGIFAFEIFLSRSSFRDYSFEIMLHYHPSIIYDLRNKFFKMKIVNLSKKFHERR